ncbi:MAG: hypothetical protein A2855_00775 [Candidatus Liptonbacteria bacterium RIFCSPHIGHO2_01_FULL_57_28]|uniref:Uncharacterized protein n=1 Tax=Candidatus Liptonbacteria bacterium RIFCSPHIGHO2_01_FULL_57_28 TaxID=1798647 RepID=A0A1G2CBQ4_9BACT|nr:MAG: hypothetical protein A2855_00775 [Candidatus Liptonbacteria bacterium RIFCSPHIGHO2_01_FULL_57_28]
MESQELENFSLNKEEFAAQVRLALANVFQEYKGRDNLLRPKMNACLEENFGIRSRDVNLQVSSDSGGFSVSFLHPVHGEIKLEA